MNDILLQVLQYMRVCSNVRIWHYSDSHTYLMYITYVMAYLLLFFATSDFYRTNTDNQWYMYIKNEICQIYIFIVCSMKKKITFIIERQRTLCYSMFHCSYLLLTELWTGNLTNQSSRTMSAI